MGFRHNVHSQAMASANELRGWRVLYATFTYVILAIVKLQLKLKGLALNFV